MTNADFTSEQAVDMRIAIRHDFQQKIQSDIDELLDSSSEDARAQIEVVDTAYQSILAPSGKAYFSTPITSGKQLYDVCRKRNIRSLAALDEFRSQKQAFFEEVILPNITTSVSAAEEVAQQYNGAVIAPSIFEAKKLRWSQNEYMNLWLRVIDRDVTDLYVREGAAYSDGAVMEMTHAMLMANDLSYRSNIRVVREDQSEVGLAELMHEIIEAALEIEQFTAPVKHAHALQKLRALCAVSDMTQLMMKYRYSRPAILLNALREVEKFLSSRQSLLIGLSPVFMITEATWSSNILLKDECLLGRKIHAENVGFKPFVAK